MVFLQALSNQILEVLRLLETAQGKIFMALLCVWRIASALAFFLLWASWKSVILGAKEKSQATSSLLVQSTLIYLPM